MGSVSDPFAELPVRNNKYAANCTELHLADKNICELQGFESFCNLVTLWINKNRLLHLNGLECNFRIRNLFAHDNRITSIANSSLLSFSFLNRLTLNNNNLTNLDETLEVLKHLRHLVSLDLSGNPISQEDNYRLLVLAELPWLTTLDRSPVTEQEVKEAKKLKKHLEKLKNVKLRVSMSNSPKDNETAKASARSEKFQLILSQIRNQVIGKRISLEPEFLEFDRRKFGLVSKEIFLRVLCDFGILDKLNEDEISFLINQYSQELKSDEKGITWGSVISEPISYQRFCKDVTQPTRLLPVTYQPDKIKSYKMEKTLEISATVKDLITFVNSNRKEAVELAEKTKRETLFAASSKDSINFTFYPDAGKKVEIASNSLSPWELSFLTKTISKIIANPQTADKNNILRNHLQHIFDEMATHGRVPSKGIVQTIDNLLDGRESISVKDLCDKLGCLYPQELKAKAPPIESKKGPSIVSARSDRTSVDIKPCVFWKNVDFGLINSMEHTAKLEAEKRLDSLLRITNDKDTKNREALFTSTMEAGLTASRLACIKPQAPKVPTDPTCTALILSAPKRSDFVVIPSLKLAAKREKQNAEFDDRYNWRRKFEDLGFKNEALDLAIERKKKSATLASTLPATNKSIYKAEPKPTNWSTGVVVLKQL